MCDWDREATLVEVLRGTETDTFLFLLSRSGCYHCCSHTCYQFNLPLCLRAYTQQHVFISPVKLVLSVVAVRPRGRLCGRTLPFLNSSHPNYHNECYKRGGGGVL